MSTEVYVFADWPSLKQPTCVGTLRSERIRNKEHFSFNYTPSWLAHPEALAVDPDLQLFTGEQHAHNDKNFRIFLDSCPDRWGRILMKRRELIQAQSEQRKPHVLNEIDYLLGVYDFHRQGALRFKTNMEGEFLDNDHRLAAPPISSLAELEHAAKKIEENKTDDPDYLKWLYMLMSPGSSLGGARPKASVIDTSQNLWIAKFPSLMDDYDIGAWEYLTYQLAINCGIKMASCKIKKLGGHHHTFLTQRFDRIQNKRLHFSSALTQLGYYDGDYEASYLELAQFLTEHGTNTKADLAQLWRRIIFNIAVANTDDHLRNHGFIHQNQGWILSPAYDINPTTPAHGLHLNITDNDNRLDFSLALEIIDFFQLSKSQALAIKKEVLDSVKQWPAIADNLGIPRSEQQQMAAAFTLES